MKCMTVTGYTCEMFAEDGVCVCMGGGGGCRGRWSEAALTRKAVSDVTVGC